MSEAIRISKEAVNAMPLAGYEGPVDLINSDSALATALAEIEQETVLGFDTESRPAFKRGQSFPVSLVQLAGEEKVWLFQLGKLSDTSGLWDLFTSDQLIKAGVAIGDDIKKLQDLSPFQPKGFVEIADLSHKVGIINTGLRSLAGLFLQFRISKRAQVSNWARKDLTEAQIQYAATDAWVSRLLYFKMKNLRPEDIPELPDPTVEESDS
jgi:ribonuclease D